MMRKPRIGDVWKQQKAYRLESRYALIIPAEEDDMLRVLDLENGDVYGPFRRDFDMWPWRLWLEAE